MVDKETYPKDELITSSTLRIENKMHMTQINALKPQSVSSSSR